MEIIRTIAGAKARLRAVQVEGLRVGLVPTMGALHEGHLSLVRRAKQSAEVVVASVFVNPTQFGPSEDFDRYPRDLDGDAAMLGGAGCDVLFAPALNEIYPGGFETIVELTRTTRGLCGDTRHGHFRGVTTIVLKLLNIVRPDVAVFGEKDFQQLAVIRRMVDDLALDVEIVGGPIVREPDGLAMSSRNAYLSEQQREQALSLSAGLQAAADLFEAGERTATTLVAAVNAPIIAAGLRPEYLELRAVADLAAIESAEGPCVLLVAARVGATRLIDNRILRES